MPRLLHEYWEGEDGAEFGPVKQRTDELRPLLTPGARLMFSLHAASWGEAMQAHNARLGYGEYRPAEGVADHAYTDREKAEQDAYLHVRPVK